MAHCNYRLLPAGLNIPNSPNCPTAHGPTAQLPNCPLPTAHCPLLTAHCSLLTAHCSLITDH